MREDLEDIVSILSKKSKRIVISTNGFFSEKIALLCNKFPNLGVRISVEGLSKANDTIRGIIGGFDSALRTLFRLREAGIKDIGLAFTIQDINIKDLVYLYYLTQALGCEFATAILHNSYYFHKWDNFINDKEKVIAEIKKLIKFLFKSKKVKDWFRAYFNYGLIRYLKAYKRLIPCEMGKHGFFLDPTGDVLPCNGMDQKQPMGNLIEQTWNNIWKSNKAQEVRQIVRNCKKNCWMIGSVAPSIWHHPIKPIKWVLKNKLIHALGKNSYIT